MFQSRVVELSSLLLVSQASLPNIDTMHVYRTTRSLSYALYIPTNFKVPFYSNRPSALDCSDMARTCKFILLPALVVVSYFKSVIWGKMFKLFTLYSNDSLYAKFFCYNRWQQFCRRRHHQRLRNRPLEGIRDSSCFLIRPVARLTVIILSNRVNIYIRVQLLHVYLTFTNNRQVGLILCQSIHKKQSRRTPSANLFACGQTILFTNYFLSSP